MTDLSNLTAEDIKSQEDKLKVRQLDSKTVFELGIAAKAIAKELYPASDVVIDISTPAGVCLFRSYQGVIAPDNEEWLRRKRNSAIKFETSTFRLKKTLAMKGQTLESKGLDPSDYVSHGGAFPLRLVAAPDLIIAVMTVSGLKDFQDHDLCVKALQKLNV